MRRLLVCLLLSLLATGRVLAQDTATPIPIVITVIIVWPTHTETPTPTDTPVPTEGPSPTPTPTVTNTPDFVYEATVEVDGIGQDVAFVYQMNAGDFAIVLFLAFIVGLQVVYLILKVKR